MDGASRRMRLAGEAAYKFRIWRQSDLMKSAITQTDVMSSHTATDIGWIPVAAAGGL